VNGKQIHVSKLRSRPATTYRRSTINFIVCELHCISVCASVFIFCQLWWTNLDINGGPWNETHIQHRYTWQENVIYRRWWTTTLVKERMINIGFVHENRLNSNWELGKTRNKSFSDNQISLTCVARPTTQYGSVTGYRRAVSKRRLRSMPSCTGPLFTLHRRIYTKLSCRKQITRTSNSGQLLHSWTSRNCICWKCSHFAVGEIHIHIHIIVYNSSWHIATRVHAAKIDRPLLRTEWCLFAAYTTAAIPLFSGPDNLQKLQWTLKIEMNFKTLKGFKVTPGHQKRCCSIGPIVYYCLY